MTIDENHLRTIEKFNLLADLLDSNGIVDENVLNKLQLNARSLLDNTNGNPELLNLCKDVIFHNNMKAFALHQLILQICHIDIFSINLAQQFTSCCKISRNFYLS